MYTENMDIYSTSMSNFSNNLLSKFRISLCQCKYNVMQYKVIQAGMISVHSTTQYVTKQEVHCIKHISVPPG